MISNADTDLIRDVYSKWNIHYLPVIRYVSCKKTRHKVGELIITSYDTGNPFL